MARVLRIWKIRWSRIWSRILMVQNLDHLVLLSAFAQEWIGALVLVWQLAGQSNHLNRAGPPLADESGCQCSTPARLKRPAAAAIKLPYAGEGHGHDLRAVSAQESTALWHVTRQSVRAGLGGRV